jgi:hypothetical protein
MKKRSQFVHIATLAGVFMIVSLVMAGMCLAGGVVAVHGNSGHVEYMNSLASTDRIYLGWGLDIDQKPGSFNWLHYSIPTTPGTKTRYLLIRYETGTTGNSADSLIKAFHVYDGENLIYYNDSIHLTGGPDYAIIDMGSDKTIYWGLGLSVNIGAGVESMSHRMRIYSIMAEWH